MTTFFFVRKLRCTFFIKHSAHMFLTHNLQSYISLYLYSLLVLLFFDGAFLYMMQKSFAVQIYSVQKIPLTFDFTAAAMCYLVLGLALALLLYYRTGVHLAALAGFIVYSVFELTNKSVFREWRWQTVILDTMWGTFLFGASYYVTSWWMQKNLASQKFLPWSAPDFGWH